MRLTACRYSAGIAACLVTLGLRTATAEPDLIIYHAKIITADPGFSVAQAMSVKNGRVVAVGTDEQVLVSRGMGSQTIDLGGKTVMPGLIDSHVHPGTAAMTEFDHEIPDMQAVADVLNYIRARAAALGPGKWIEVQQ